VQTYIVHYKNIDTNECGKVEVRTEDMRMGAIFQASKVLESDFGEEGFKLIEIVDVEHVQNGYVCFYKGKRFEVYAETPYDAQCKVAIENKVKDKNRYQITVMLAELNGKQVTHIADF